MTTFFSPILFIVVIKNCFFFVLKKNYIYHVVPIAKVEVFGLLAVFVSDFYNFSILPSKSTKISY